MGPSIWSNTTMGDERIHDLVHKQILPLPIKEAKKGNLYRVVFGLDDQVRWQSRQSLPPIYFWVEDNWKLLGSKLRLMATTTRRNKFYLMNKTGKGRVYFATDPAQRALGNETLAPYREASICPILEYKVRDVNGRPCRSDGAPIDWEGRKKLDVVRTHCRWHEGKHTDDGPAHVLSHFTMAHGAGTVAVLASSILDCSPSRPLQWAYGGNYLHSTFSHYTKLTLSCAGSWL